MFSLMPENEYKNITGLEDMQNIPFSLTSPMKSRFHLTPDSSSGASDFLSSLPGMLGNLPGIPGRAAKGVSTGLATAASMGSPWGAVAGLGSSGLLGKKASGALSGAASGAQLGMAGGPIGMGIGAGVGGLMGLLSGKGGGGSGQVPVSPVQMEGVA